MDQTLEKNSSLNEKQRAVRDQLKHLLSGAVVEVHFTKKDGTLREMICTLDPKYIPEDEYTVASGNQDLPKIKRSDATLAVYDLEKRGWRSFRIDSVHEYLARRAEASW